MERKKYCTGFYSMQLLLSNVEGIEIEDIIIKEVGTRKYKNVLFSFPGHKGREVAAIINKCKDNVNKVQIDNFKKLKAKRKKLLDEYYKRKCN